MNPKMRPAALGAAVGFFVMICILLFRVRTPLVVYGLWPTRILEHAASGGFWLLLFRAVAFFANAFLYGLIGYWLGCYIEGRRSRDGR
ncbi:MAG TPA: hypothetical protein VLI45_02550 [Acidobacteriaceae bacterium]|nr:hypothetical protein [Acidobacteriaceae bacterium]